MDSLHWILLVIECLIGLLICFGGYRFKSKILAVIWFIVGYLVAKQFAPLLVEDEKIIFLLTVLGGLIFAFFSYNLTAISEYLFGFYAGFTIVTSFLGLTLVGIIVGVIVGLIVAAIANRFSKYIIIVATAYLGATLAAPIIPALITDIGVEVNVLTVILFVVGAIVQFLTTLNMK